MRDWDSETIRKQSITSLELMERAALRCAEWIINQTSPSASIGVLCGSGNNGGDGLAIARLLHHQNRNVQVFVTTDPTVGSPDFLSNLNRLEPLDPVALWGEKDFEKLKNHEIIVDALFGTGLNKPIDGYLASLVQYINSLSLPVISIDLPSGLFADRSSKGNAVVRAHHTLTFQTWKLGLLLPENASAVGMVTVLDIGLDPSFADSREGIAEITDSAAAARIYKPRDRFAHKGHFGHALLLAGSYGKMGAAVLAARACLRAGSGLLTVCVPRCGYQIIQLAVPGAMAATDDNDEHLENLPADIERYSSVGIGPGLGQAEGTQRLVSFLLRRYRGRLVLDADALNIVAERKDWLTQLPKESILTPHPKEFDRLAGPHESDFERMESARKMAMAFSVILVLKGHHTLVALPDGQLFFNMSGNAGMAKGGSGDALTGIITSLAGQRYTAAEAAILGVYLHSSAGDAAAAKHGEEAMTPGDLIECLGLAFQKLRGKG